MNKNAFSEYIYLIVIIFLIAGVSILFNSSINSPEDDFSKDNFQKDEWKKQSFEDKKNENLNPSQSNNKNNNQGSGGGSSSSSGGSNSDSKLTCTTKQLIYTIQENFKNETCIEYDLEDNCIEKTIFCSAKIKNQDSVKGNFNIRLVFVEDKKDKETEFFGETTESFTLNPGELKHISNEETILSSGSNGIANKIINCFFNTIGNVEGEFCS